MSVERGHVGTLAPMSQEAEAQALHHINALEAQARAQAAHHGAPDDVHTVAVVGAGTVAARITLALLRAGVRVIHAETETAEGSPGEISIDHLIAAQGEAGSITSRDAAAYRSRLKIRETGLDLAAATFAIQAGQESLARRQQVLNEMAAYLSPDAVMAVHTAHLDVSALAGGLADPSRLVGLHLGQPADKAPLLEVALTAHTSARARAVTLALAGKLDKVPVLSRAAASCISSRLLTRYHEAADTVFMDGSTPWEVDTAMTDFGFNMGPYEAEDLIGLDIAHAERRRQDATRDPKRRYIPIADRMIELGKLGKKTGAGWYRYPGGTGKVDDPIVADLAIEEAYFAKTTRCDYSEDEIRERLLLAMINAGADILYEGAVARASDIDLISVLGCGFPRQRGGVMSYADGLGIDNILTALRRLAVEDPIAWAPSPVFAACLAQGVGLADYAST